MAITIIIVAILLILGLARDSGSIVPNPILMLGFLILLFVFLPLALVKGSNSSKVPDSEVTNKDVEKKKRHTGLAFVALVIGCVPLGIIMIFDNLSNTLLGDFLWFFVIPIGLFIAIYSIFYIVHSLQQGK